MNLAVAITSIVVAATQPVRADYDHGKWTITERTASSAYIELVWPDGSNWKNLIELSSLDGLRRADMAQVPRSHVFRIIEDAGRFDFEGIVGAGRGTGEFHFTPDGAFTARLVSLGITDVSDLTDWDLTNLAWGRFSTRSAHEFAALGLAPQSKNDMMELAVQHVTPHFVRSLRSLGVTDLDTIHDVVAARMFGVTPEFVRALGMAGVTGLSGQDLVSLRMSGVTADFVKAANQAGLRDLSPRKLMEMRHRAQRGNL